MRVCYFLTFRYGQKKLPQLANVDDARWRYSAVSVVFQAVETITVLTTCDTGHTPQSIAA